MTIHHLPQTRATDTAAPEYAECIAAGVQEAQTNAALARPRRSRWLMPLVAGITLFIIDEFLGFSHAVAFACGSIITALYMMIQAMRSDEFDQQAAKQFLHSVLPHRSPG